MHTQQQLLELLDASPDPMLSIALDGSIARANRMAANFFGYSVEELLAMKVEQLIPERYRAGHPGKRTGYFKDPHFRPMGIGRTLSTLTRDGREPNVEISLSYSGEGESRLATVTLRDVTEQVAATRALKEAQEQLQVLLDTSPDPMLSIAIDGSIVRANRMAVNFFGYSAEELLSMKVEQLIPERYRASHPGLRTGYFRDPHFRPMGIGRTLSTLTRDGREPNVEISLSHSGEGGNRLATVTLRDVTEQVAATNALKEARAQAEHALDRQRTMQEELVRSEKLAALGGLVAGVSHEVNTPIGVALTAASHLEAETARARALYAREELSEQDLADYFQAATESSRLLIMNIRRAADLIQSFKQVAVDQVSGERRYFDLARYLNEILLSLRPMLRRRTVDISIECPDGITMDSNPGALSQVITNLVNNALVHAFEKGQRGQMKLVARVVGDDIELTCSDSGKGIPKELHEKIFEPFFTTRRSTGGSGLGLHIVFNLVRQALHGTIVMDSTPGKGTSFTMRLPRILSHEGLHVDD